LEKKKYKEKRTRGEVENIKILRKELHTIWLGEKGVGREKIIREKIVKSP